MNNPGFNSVEFDRIKTVAGLNNFRLSAKEWMESVWYDSTTMEILGSTERDILKITKYANFVIHQ